MLTIYSYYFEEYLFKFSFEAEEGAGAPPWLDSDAFPPLSPRQAIDASKNAVAEMLKAYPWADPQFSACALKRTTESEGGWWYYDVEWMVWPPECDGGDRSGINVPVMLNGRVPSFEVFKYQDRFKAWES
ncbi:hypothetical protein SAMN04488540_1122 [Ferrimonas sediminum]|uniref:Uncharacterized protein n=1 Tax=Ferrimonas sediminum TaxID=718193 RepID=A0A1G8VVE3_9GAMM|nr:hypothetical protein [Ferrimonas sediminum]SDJ69946.1 hypothetical protein SAMN04488540_1122 [Ferrimonas sediminum]